MWPEGLVCSPRPDGLLAEAQLPFPPSLLLLPAAERLPQHPAAQLSLPAQHATPLLLASAQSAPQERTIRPVVLPMSISSWLPKL